MAAPIAAFIVAAIGVTGTAAAVTTAIVTAGVNLAIGAAVSALLPSPEVRAASGSPITWQADPDAPIPFVGGRRGVAGQIVHREAYGPDNRYQGIVTVYSGAGPINAYSTIKFDDVVYTFDGSTGACLTPSGKPNRIWFSTRLGAQPDTALAGPAGLEGDTTGLPNWGTDHKLSGKACSLVTYRQNGEHTYWATGEAKPLILIQGIKIYEPRLDSTYPGGSGACRLNDRSTWVYSTNPATHALNWALGMKENGKLVGGIGASIGNIDVAAFVDAANTADANGWTCSSIAYSSDDKYQVLQAFLQAAGAIPSRTAGKISCVNIAAPKTSVVTITVDDTAGAFELDAGSPRSGRINTVTPRCVQEASDWQMVDLVPVAGSTYVTEDGGATRSRRIDYPFVSDEDQGAQLAAYDIANSREGLSGTILLKPYLRELKPGDAFLIDEPGFVLDGQKFMVLRRSYDPATDLVTITFRSETDAKHAWATGQTGTPPASPSLSPVQPDDVATPDAADWVLSSPGGTTPRLLVTGDAPAAAVNVGRVVFEYRLDGDTAWTPYTTTVSDPGAINISGLEANEAYEVAVSYRNGFGYTGGRLVLGPETTGGVVGGDIDDETVGTIQIEPNAATVFATQVSNAGYAGAGPRTIGYNVSQTEPNATTVDDMVLTADQHGTISVHWDGLVQWSNNNDRSIKCWLQVTRNYSGTPVTYTANSQTIYGTDQFVSTPVALNASIDVEGDNDDIYVAVRMIYSHNDATKPTLDPGAAMLVWEGKR